MKLAHCVGLLAAIFTLVTSPLRADEMAAPANAGEASFAHTARQTLGNVDDYLYRLPRELGPMPADQGLSCVELDNTIVALSPLTYRVVPGFYDDNYQGAAFWLGTTGRAPDIEVPLLEIPLWYLYFGYTMYKQYQDEERVFHVSHRIEQLRRVKAQKRCFES